MKIALLQRGLAAAWLGIFLLCTIGCFVRGASAVGIAGGFFILTGPALFLAGEFALMRAAQRRICGATPSIRSVVKAWRAELFIAASVFLWRQPFRAAIEPDHLSPQALGNAGVLLVHGLACNRGVWNPWIRRLRERDIACMAVTLEPPFGSIDDYADTLEQAVQTLFAVTGRPPILVGHSMGGLAIRAWLSANRGTETSPNPTTTPKNLGTSALVHSVITVGSPHHGTWLARFALPENARQMRIGSAWLAGLELTEDAALRALFTCYWSDCDQIVYPQHGTFLAGAHCRRLQGFGHLHLLDCPAIFDDLLHRVQLR